MVDRLAVVRQRFIQMGLGGVVLYAPPHIAYLVDVTVSPEYWHFLVISETSASLVLPDFEAERTTSWLNMIPYPAGVHPDPALPRLRHALHDLTPGTGVIGIEFQFIPARVARFLSHEMGFELKDVTDLVTELRVTKEPGEVERIRQTVRLCEAGFEAAQETIAAGRSELDVGVAVFQAVSLAAGELLAFAGDFISGLRTVDVGGPPGLRQLGPGDLFIVDLYPSFNGYCADVSRTFVVGRPLAWHKDVHKTLEEAFEAGLSVIRPGVTCHDLDATIRRVIAAAGYGDSMRHDVSHGIGLTPHESPEVVPGNHTVLKEGMVITIEPGVYIPGKGGLRLEDDVLVTAQGCETLGHFPLRLITSG